MPPPAASGVGARLDEAVDVASRGWRQERSRRAGRRPRLHNEGRRHDRATLHTRPPRYRPELRTELSAAEAAAAAAYSGDGSAGGGGARRLVIIRHGQTLHNQLGLFTGWQVG